MPRRHPDRRLAAPAWGFASALMLLPLVARAQTDFPSELQQIERIRFEGRHHIAEKELKAVMKTRPPSSLPWRERPVLRLDFLHADTLAIAGVYRQHGYLDAGASVRVHSLRQVGRAELIFTIREGKPSVVRAVEFTGVHAIPESQLHQRLYTRHGRPFNPSALIVDTLRIAEAYQDRGYLPRVTADTLRRADEITVRYEVFEGPLFHFGEVYYSSPGALGVKRRLIERMLDMHSGDIYRRSRVQRSVEHLYATDLFRSIQVTPFPDSATSLMEISMRLEERKRRWIDAGISSGTSARFSVNGSWGHRNLAGQGIAGSVGSRLSLDQDWNFLLWRNEATLRTPALFGIRASGQATGYFSRSDDRESDPEHRWIVHQWGPGVQFRVQREFSRVLRLTATQDNAFIHQNVTFLIPQPSDSLVDSLFANVLPHYTTHLLNLTLDRDLRDDPLVPTHGSYQSLSGEIAGGPLKGSSSYTKGQMASAWFAPVQANWVLVFQVRAGAAAPFGSAVQFTPADTAVSEEVASVPLANRFRIGGVNSVRGFAENSLAPGGGLAMFQANIELRIPLAGPLGVEFYADGGNIWPAARDIHLGDFVPYAGSKPVEPGDMRYVFGFGPRLNLPFGPLRFDLTWSPRPIDATGRWFKGERQFAIGSSF